MQYRLNHLAFRWDKVIKLGSILLEKYDLLYDDKNIKC